jgi:hypothetical protein
MFWAIITSSPLPTLFKLRDIRHPISNTSSTSVLYVVFLYSTSVEFIRHNKLPYPTELLNNIEAGSLSIQAPFLYFEAMVRSTFHDFISKSQLHSNISGVESV